MLQETEDQDVITAPEKRLIDSKSTSLSSSPTSATTGQQSASIHPCLAVSVVALACVPGLLGIAAVLIGVLVPNELSIGLHVVVALCFVGVAQLPTVTGVVFVACRKPVAGAVHIASLASVTILLSCGLLTNVRVMKESDLSEYCEKHFRFCEYTTDAATAVTVALIGICTAVGVS